MSIPLNKLEEVFIVCGKTDMHQGIDSLAYWIQHHYQLDPFPGQVFLFCGGKKIFKALYWNGEGFWLLYKRLKNGKLSWPSNEKEVKALSDKQVEWVLKRFSVYPKIKDTNLRHFYV